MTRALLAVCLACALTVTVGATDIRDYQVTVTTNTAGAAEATLRVFVPKATSVIRIPVGFSGITEVRLIEGPVGATVTTERAGSQTMLAVQLNGDVQGEIVLSIAFQIAALVPEPVVPAGERPTLPAGHRLLRHSFVNTQEGTIGRYVIRVVFPEHLRAHVIREALPKLRGQEAGPRARLEPVDGQRAVTLEVAALKQGDVTSLQVELTPLGRSWVWLLTGVVLSVLYLFSFRSLVAGRVSSGARGEV